MAIHASSKWRASSNMTRSKNRIISELACGVRTSNTASKDSSLSDQSLCLKKSGRSSASNMGTSKSRSCRRSSLLEPSDLRISKAHAETKDLLFLGVNLPGLEIKTQWHANPGHVHCRVKAAL